MWTPLSVNRRMQIWKQNTSSNDDDDSSHRWRAAQPGQQPDPRIEMPLCWLACSAVSHPPAASHGLGSSGR